MTKAGKIITATLGLFLIHWIYNFLVYGHSFDDKSCRNYMWLFKDSIKKDISFVPIPLKDHFTKFCSGYSKKNDFYNFFFYRDNKNSYSVLVWEFKNLNHLDLNEIQFNQNVRLSTEKIWSGEVLDAKSSSPTTIKYGFKFKQNMNVNLNEFSKIDGTFSGKNYKGFYGVTDQMSLSNEKGQHQIFFGGDHLMNLWDLEPKEQEVSYRQTMLIVYKGHKSFYLIIIDAEKPFKDASILNIFNLEE